MLLFANMTSNEIRSKYLKFFADRGHAVIPSASLVPENDPTTLFTGSGMQPLLPYLLGQPHPKGTRLVDSQKAFRSGDIEEVGDNRHTTCFEMLGNWSFGDYFKKEQIIWFWEFLTKEINLDPKRIFVTCYIGNPEAGIPKDTESADIWREVFAKAGIEAKEVDIGTEERGYEVGEQGGRIFFYGDKNWWSRAGAPHKMPAGEPGGPDTEMFYLFPEVQHDPKWGANCHPNCDCGRYIELGNSVFMEYLKTETGYENLPKKNVDYGGGLERIAAAANNSADIFPVAHAPILAFVEQLSGRRYADDKFAFRVIADHMKAAVFLISDGVRPSNVEQGYFVRRLIRRSVRYADKLGVKENAFASVVRPIAEMYKDQYPDISEKSIEIEKVIAEEESKFRETLSRGLKEFEKLAKGDTISGHDAYVLFTTHGFPLELTQELAKERGASVDLDAFKKEMDSHRDLSRAGAEQKFKGGLADQSEATVRLHTTHHILLKALQMILGDHVKQRGSNITGERLRIDFSHTAKMTDDEKKKVEDIVNEKIKEHLPMIRSTMPKEEAEKLNAQHEFGAKYPDMVSVYSLGPLGATKDRPLYDQSFSIEFCGGPHVANTSEIEKGGIFKIQKEEAVAAGIRRIKAVLQ